jgi:hypothetical protein
VAWVTGEAVPNAMGAVGVLEAAAVDEVGGCVGGVSGRAMQCVHESGEDGREGRLKAYSCVGIVSFTGLTLTACAL